MSRFFSLILTALFLFLVHYSIGQTKRNVLFLGNSYTAGNNLPQLIKDVALSAGDSLIYDSHTPGGYTLEDHNADPTATNKIAAGGWDYVVLQEQSQRPITRTSKFKNFGSTLNNRVIQDNPCAVTMLYMTWGRKNGDASNCASFPVMCTYEGMDSTLRNTYLELAETIQAEVSPVSAVWKFLRDNHSNIELYQTDESHPSQAGSYAAACSFYAAIFKKDPSLITFNFGLSAADAAAIRNAAKVVVFDQLNSWDFKQAPQSDFWYEVGAGVNEIYLRHSNFTETYFWDFGDGATSTMRLPSHSYASNGTYKVTLTTTNCDLQGLHTSTSDTTLQFCSHTPTIFTANPWMCQNDTLRTQLADSYQWFQARKLLPETNSYIAEPSQYDGSDFTVLAEVAGCAELSQAFNFSPEWSGYYFDAQGGDPCDGDTVPFAVLYALDTALNGTEVIRWYKNGILQSQFNDRDTFLITTEGVYECKVVNPSSVRCPLDTTYYKLEYKCEIVGLKSVAPDLFWRAYPNPASEFLTIELRETSVQAEIKVFDAFGRVVQVIKPTESVRSVDISALPAGLYFITLEDSSKHSALKFIKR